MRPTARSLASLAAGSVLLGTVAGSSALADAAPSAEGPLTGLRVLLTNDDSMRAEEEDGSDGLGLYEVRKSLCEAGADVVVFAPWKPQSGASGGATPTEPLSVDRRTAPPVGYADDCSGAAQQGAVYGVCLSGSGCAGDSPSATPADSVRLALKAGLGRTTGWREPPDLVVSGVNSGPNVGREITMSGTVGAASAAIDEGVPAVALSGGLDDDHSVTPETYAATSTFAVDLIARMDRDDRLTPSYIANVNHPDSPDGTPAERAAWTVMGTGGVLGGGYSGEGDTFVPEVVPCQGGGEGCPEEKRENADTTAVFERGEISVTPLTNDRTYSGEDASGMRGLVRGAA